jgi:ketosteroid isomerase-like protein
LGRIIGIDLRLVEPVDCKGEAMPGSRSRQMPPRPIDIVRHCFNAWSAGDLPGVMSLLSPHCIYDLHVPVDVLSYGGRHEGKDAIEACLMAIRAEFHFMAYAIGALKEDGDLVRGQITFYFRHRKTGELLDGRCRHLTRVKDDLIVSIEEFHDVEMLRAFVAMARSQDYQ